MEYVELNKAILRVTNVETKEIVENVCEYIGAREKDVRWAMMPIIKLWEISDENEEPMICKWRHLRTSQYEGYVLSKIAEKKNCMPLCLTYIGDIFSKNNPEKIIFEKIKIFHGKGKNVETRHLYANKKGKSIDEQLSEIEGKPFRDIKINNNISLIDYHLELRKMAGFKDENIIDLGEIFEKLVKLCPDWRNLSHCDGRPYKDWYYPIWMILSSKLIVLEDFEICKDEMKSLIEYSYEKAVKNGLKPNFVRLNGKKSLDWYMTKPEEEGGVPDSIKKIIEEMK